MSVAPPSATPGGTSARSVTLRTGVYADSVRLMQISRDIGARDGVTAVLVAMATPLNVELAANMGLTPEDEASPEQLLIATVPAGPKGALIPWWQSQQGKDFQAILQHPLPVTNYMIPVVVSAGKNRQLGLDLTTPTMTVINATQANDNIYSYRQRIGGRGD